MGYYEDLGKRNQALRNEIFPSNVNGIAIRRVKGLKPKATVKTDMSKPAISKTRSVRPYKYNPDRFVTGKRGTSGAVYGD